jgi:hypothetical protein
VCHRDVELACLWLRWVAFLTRQPGGKRPHILVIFTQRTDLAPLAAAIEGASGIGLVRCPDEDESGYPRSASHLFLRTLEQAEERFPGSAVLWCEADTVPMKPSWFADIAAEYQTCGKPFLGVTVGTKHKQLSGIAVYPSDWRKLAPKLASVLSAPDMPQWGHGKGMPWDVFARDQTVPQMAESKLMTNVWKNRDIRATRLREVPSRTVLFHQDKTGALIREIAAAQYPDFMATLTTHRRFFFMNGHPVRLKAKGLSMRFSYSKFDTGFHRSAVCSDELSDENANALAMLVGQLGVREIDEEEFLKITGREAKSLPPQRVRPPVAEPSKYSHPHVYVMLGRYGDIMNCLPFLKADADAGHRPTLVVSKDFADILDGVGYCDRIVWDDAYDKLEEALRWLRRDRGIKAPVVCQVHRNPYDKGRLTRSYQTEVWRLAGRLPEFDARGPLVFDQRDTGRELRLLDRTAYWDGRPLVLVGLTSHSSPLAQQRKITDAVVKELAATCQIVHLDLIKAERIYDLLALFDLAALLVASDTAHIHLARASRVPLLALLNDGWRGSVCEHAAGTIRYVDATPEAVVREAKRILVPTTVLSSTPSYAAKRPLTEGPKVYHVVDPHGSEPRHHVAQSSWLAAYQEGMIAAHFRGSPRNAKVELGDPRFLPFLKDVLWSAIPDDATKSGLDIILWTNSDTGFAPGITDAIRQHVGRHGAASMRRTESNGNGHPGRDLFAFTIDWLEEHWDEIPDFVLGAPVFDLGLVALIRRFHKLPPLTLKTLSHDMPPADMPPGYALHQSHAPEWQVANMDSVPSVAHNKKVFREWNKKYHGGLAFSPGGNLK